MRGGLALAALLLCGCAGLRPGLSEKGPVLEVALERAAGEGRAAAVAAAQRRAVEQTLGLLVSPAARSASAAVLEEKVLGSPQDYVKKHRPLKGRFGARLLVLMAWDKLCRDVDALGLVRPDGIYGIPRLLVSIKETGPGAGSELGRASDALRRGLSLRGFDALDLSDRIGGDRRKTGSITEATAAAKAAGAQIVVSGAASAQPAGTQVMRARLRARAVWAISGRPLAEADVEATGADLSAPAAAARALENAGLAAADEFAESFAGLSRNRSAVGLSVAGLGDIAGVRAFLDELRALPGVAAAAAAAFRPEGVLFQVFVEGLSSEDLAVRLMRLPGHSLEVRAVETERGLVEVEIMGRSGTKQGPQSYDK
jgi:hypothetical protein